jgi:hypothetical protein
MKKTTSLQTLAEANVKHIKVTKAGEYIPRKSKKGASHLVTETKNSIIAEPRKKWPKHKPGKAYGPPRVSTEQPKVPTIPGLPDIPPDTTHLEYSNSKVAVVAPIEMLEDYQHFRGGKIRFGKLRYDEDFISLMPDEPAALEAAAKKTVLLEKLKELRAKHPKAPKAPRMLTVATEQKKGAFKYGHTSDGITYFIDCLVMEGGRTAEEICAMTFKKYPDKERLSTVKVRPSMLRQKGYTPPPFKK